MKKPRPLTTADEARRVIAALIARDYPGELPPLSEWHLILDRDIGRSRCSPAETLPLHGRALFAPATIPADARDWAEWSRESFFTELGAPLGVTARALIAAVRAGVLTLAPPRNIPGYDYLGRFTSDGTLDIADPCHLRKPGRLLTVYGRTLTLDALPGTWHAYASTGGRKEDKKYTAELVAIHDLGLDLAATSVAGKFPVDARMAGVFDRACPEPTPLDPRVEGILHDRGVLSYSGMNDGAYPVIVARIDGRIAKLRIPFLDRDHPRQDPTVPR